MIAITGASGYLGRALLPVLVQHYGHRGGVVALARQATAHSPTRHFDLTEQLASPNALRVSPHWYTVQVWPMLMAVSRHIPLSMCKAP